MDSYSFYSKELSCMKSEVVCKINREKKIIILWDIFRSEYHYDSIINLLIWFLDN